MGGEQKKSSKKRVAVGKTSAYWGWTWPRNRARKALAALRRDVRLGVDPKVAEGRAKSLCELYDAQGANSPTKPQVSVAAEFVRLLRKGEGK